MKGPEDHRRQQGTEIDHHLVGPHRQEGDRRQDQTVEDGEAIGRHQADRHQDGERIGLVNIVVPHDQLDAEVARAFA